MAGNRRGETDLQKLLAFIVGVTAVLVVVPAAFGLAGVDIRDGSVGTGDGAPTLDADEEPEDGALLVLSAFGTEINADRTTVGVVELVVTPADDTVELDDVTVTWDGADRYELTPTHVGAGDASFGVQTTSGESSLQPGERAFIRFDLGTDDLGVQRFGDRLEPGDTVTVTVTTGDGAETTETVTVPNPLPPGSAVRFG